MISGYFLYSPSPEESSRRAFKSLRSTAKIFLLVSVFYWAWLLPNHGNILHSWSQVKSWVLTGSLFSGHIWYLMAMLQGLLVLGLCFRLGWARVLWLFIPLALLAPLSGQYAFLLTAARTDYVFPVFNSICYALPCMSMGYFIGKYEQRLMLFSHWGVILLGGLVLLYGERVLLEFAGYGYSPGIFLGSYLVACLFLLLGLQCQSWGQGTLAVTIGQSYSGNIYYFHIAVATLVSKVLFACGLGVLYQQTGSLWVFVASLAVAWLVVRVQGALGVRVLR